MPQLSIHSPVGDLTISEDEGKIVAVDWGWGRDQDHTPLLDHTAHLLNRYFDGETVAFDLPLDPYGSTFQRAVWDIMLNIPYGETLTYGEVSQKLNSSARAVGTACGRTPIPIIIPCHRILASGGNLGGYTADGGVEIKEALLNLEGALNTPQLSFKI